MAKAKAGKHAQVIPVEVGMLEAELEKSRGFASKLQEDLTNSKIDIANV